MKNPIEKLNKKLDLDEMNLDDFELIFDDSDLELFDDIESEIDLDDIDQDAA